MRFSWFGGFIIQFYEGTEGHLLKEVGLIELREAGDDCEAEPTDKLRAMCDCRPDLDTLYPNLVELVICFKYPRMFINQRHVEWRLMRAGMTQDGLELLQDMISQEFRIR
jgi:hypothetical protein